MHTSPSEKSTIRTTRSAHEHAWLTESAHRISTGTLLYVRCGECGVRRVDVAAWADQPPTAVSIPLADRPDFAHNEQRT